MIKDLFNWGLLLCTNRNFLGDNLVFNIMDPGTKINKGIIRLDISLEVLLI